MADSRFKIGSDTPPPLRSATLVSPADAAVEESNYLSITVLSAVKCRHEVISELFQCEVQMIGERISN